MISIKPETSLVVPRNSEYKSNLNFKVNMF